MTSETILLEKLMDYLYAGATMRIGAEKGQCFVSLRLASGKTLVSARPWLPDAIRGVIELAEEETKRVR